MVEPVACAKTVEWTVLDFFVQVRLEGQAVSLPLTAWNTRHSSNDLSRFNSRSSFSISPYSYGVISS
jgi:hypothetical protein